MADEQVNGLLIAPPEQWDWKIAGKKVSYGLAKIIIAKASSPAIIDGFNAFTGSLSHIGVILKIDPIILSNALPGIIFAGLIALHDIGKLKLKYSWL